MTSWALPAARVCVGVVASLSFLLWEPVPARAYRPFDSTDADVAAAGELELELGPVGFLRPADGGALLVVPAVIVNLGLLPRLELVVEGQHLYDVEQATGKARSRLAENAVFLKGLVVPGALQGGAGASVALEAGVLLPGLNEEPGWGVEGLAVLSLAGSAGMLHLNGVAAWTRDDQVGLGAGLIVEAPVAWPLRPVAELLHVRAVGGDALSSALVGGIWEPTDALAFDAGARLFDDGGARGFELRLGLTWKMQLWNGR